MHLHSYILFCFRLDTCSHSLKFLNEIIKAEQHSQYLVIHEYKALKKIYKIGIWVF